jgi:hypothetical protein
MEDKEWLENQILGRCLVWHFPFGGSIFDLYLLCNEPVKTIQQIWDGSTLKLIFRRNFCSTSNATMV